VPRVRFPSLASWLSATSGELYKGPQKGLSFFWAFSVLYHYTNGHKGCQPIILRPGNGHISNLASNIPALQ
jgi:hypothetical protein